MKIKKNVWIIVVLLISITCYNMNASATNYCNSIKPRIPQSVSIDINNDGIIDFEISYSKSESCDSPSSSGSISGSIRAQYDNQFLFRKHVGHLFLKENDTIRISGNSNSNWLNYPARLITIGRDHEFWEKEWSVNSDLSTDYLLGIKLKSDGIEQIGWILLNLNTTNGEITILDSKIMNINEFIIKK